MMMEEDHISEDGLVEPYQEFRDAGDAFLRKWMGPSIWSHHRNNTQDVDNLLTETGAVFLQNWMGEENLSNWLELRKSAKHGNNQEFVSWILTVIQDVGIIAVEAKRSPDEVDSLMRTAEHSSEDTDSSAPAMMDVATPVSLESSADICAVKLEPPEVEDSCDSYHNNKVQPELESDQEMGLLQETDASVCQSVSVPVSDITHDVASAQHETSKEILDMQSVNFSCSECEFTTQDHSCIKQHMLTIHGRTYLGTNAYYCEECNYETYNLRDIMFHMEKIHAVSRNGSLNTDVPNKSEKHVKHKRANNSDKHELNSPVGRHVDNEKPEVVHDSVSCDKVYSSQENLESSEENSGTDSPQIHLDTGSPVSSDGKEMNDLANPSVGELLEDKSDDTEHQHSPTDPTSQVRTGRSRRRTRKARSRVEKLATKPKRRKPGSNPKYPCTICGKFYRKNFLKKHFIAMHVDDCDKPVLPKKFLCDVCGFTTAYHGVLTTHKRSHGEKNLLCDQCEYKTIYKHRLALHTLACHSEEKNELCTECGMKFYTKGSLQKHVKGVHLKIKNHFCNLCDFKSFSKTELKKHMRVHTGDKPHACDMCEYKCSHLTNLKTHKRLVHKMI